MYDDRDHKKKLIRCCVFNKVRIMCFRYIYAFMEDEVNDIELPNRQISQQIR